MLTELTLSHFKSWRKISSMRLAPITGLFGTNSSGKSSILQFLLLLKQTTEADDRKIVLDFGDENSRVNLGGFLDIVHGHNENHAIEFALAWQAPEAIKILDDLRKQTRASSQDMGLEVSIHQRKKGLCATKLEYSHGDDTYGIYEKSGVMSKYDLKTSINKKVFKFIREQGRGWPLPAPLKFYGFPDKTYAYYQNASFLADLQLAFVEQMERVHYLGPLRDYPRRYYTSKGATPSDMGAKGEYVVDAILASRQRGKYISPGRGKKKQTLEERIATWLKKFKLIHSFEVKLIGQNSGLYEVVVKRTPRSEEVLITDVGFGVSQVLPVLVLCYYAEEGSTILLEQPEIHLHPRVQMGLADVFIDVIKNRNVQIILESHSEHLLNRLQRRIAEEKATRDDMALYFCDAGPTASQLKPLELNSFGDIANWPKDFFGDRFGETAARQQAGLKTRLEEEANS